MRVARPFYQLFIHGYPNSSSDAGSAKPHVDPPPPPPHGSPYDRVIASLLPQINACVHDHADPTMPTMAVLHLGIDGRPKTVSLEPSAANGTALGGCIRGVLQGAHFPHAAAETDLKFPFHAKSG